MTAAIPNLRDILLRVRYLVAHAPPEFQEELAERARTLVATLRPLIEGQQPEAPSPPPPAQLEPTVQSQVPDIARQLWALSRGNPDIFTAYARSYPNPELQQIAQNPAQLNALMNQINETQTELPLGHADGINQAPLQSSNVDRFINTMECQDRFLRCLLMEMGWLGRLDPIDGAVGGVESSQALEPP